MEEKKNTFEMDDSHFDSIEEIIRKYKTSEPKASRNKRSDCKREELLNYIKEKEANPFIGSLKPTDLIDLPDIATRIMEYFGYQTIVLETPYGSKSRTVLVMGRWVNGFLITLQDAAKEYTNWYTGYTGNKTIDKSPAECNAFPSYTQFMAIYCYHIENMLKAPNGRNQQSFSCITGYIFRQLAALYLYKKYQNKLGIDCVLKSAPKLSNIWQPILNFFQVGLLSNVAKFASNGFLIGGLRLAMPGYINDDITGTTINNLAFLNDIDKNNVKHLTDILSGQKVEHLKKFLWLIGKVMLGDLFVRQLRPKESHLTIIQYHKPNLIATCLSNIFNHLLEIIDRPQLFTFLMNLRGYNRYLLVNDYDIFTQNPNNIISNHILNQLNGIQVYVITEPDANKTIRNLDFYKELFPGNKVTYEGAYDKIVNEKIKKDGKEETQQLHYSIPNGLNYTCNAQTIFITKGKSDMAFKLSDAKKTDINYIDIDWDLAPLEDFIQKGAITPIVAGKLAMMSMVYMMNKLCLGVDAFEMVEQSTSSRYQEGKTESEYISEFYADCIKDFTGDLDSAGIIKVAQSIKFDKNKSGNPVKVTPEIKAKLQDLPTVTSSDLLAAYKEWKNIKKIDFQKLTWTRFSKELLIHLNVMKNQELVKYKEIFLCRKSTSQYTQAKTSTFKPKEQPTGIIGIQIDKAWFEKLTNEKAVQEAQEKEKYEKVLALLEAQFNDAMKEIQSFKIHPQPYMP